MLTWQASGQFVIQLMGTVAKGPVGVDFRDVVCIFVVRVAGNERGVGGGRRDEGVNGWTPYQPASD